MPLLANKTAVITGAGSGMGKAMTEVFLKEGCNVLAADIHTNRMNALEKEIGPAQGKLSTLVINMADEADIEKMIHTAIQVFGGIDILINNAGIMDHFAPVGELDNAMWEKVMKVNVDGPLKAMRSVIPHFLKKSKGVIINIASIGGIQGARAGAAYTASKHALIGLTKNTGYMYSKSGIRCNAIAPGAVTTNIGDTIDMGKITPLVNDRIMAGMVLNPRTANASEIAGVALFLASDAASFVNGAVITADGGWTAY